MYETVLLVHRIFVLKQIIKKMGNFAQNAVGLRPKDGKGFQSCKIALDKIYTRTSMQQPLAKLSV